MHGDPGPAVFTATTPLTRPGDVPAEVVFPVPSMKAMGSMGPGSDRLDPDAPEPVGPAAHAAAPALASGSVQETGRGSIPETPAPIIGAAISSGFDRPKPRPPVIHTNGNMRDAHPESTLSPARAYKPADESDQMRRQARLKGYEGDACTECGQFTMVRNGTCLKCISCGATSGCS